MGCIGTKEERVKKEQDQKAKDEIAAMPRQARKTRTFKSTFEVL